MIILWLTNIPLPMYMESKGNIEYTGGGWLDTMSRQLSCFNPIVSVFPSTEEGIEQINTNKYISFLKDADNIEQFRKILRYTNPDVIHIWGTEFKHTYEMVVAALREGLIERTIISIQGSSYFLGKYHYYAGLSPLVIL